MLILKVRINACPGVLDIDQLLIALKFQLSIPSVLAMKL